MLAKIPRYPDSFLASAVANQADRLYSTAHRGGAMKRLGKRGRNMTMELPKMGGELHHVNPLSRVTQRL